LRNEEIEVRRHVRSQFGWFDDWGFQTLGEKKSVEWNRLIGHLPVRGEGKALAAKRVRISGEGLGLREGGKVISIPEY